MPLLFAIAADGMEMLERSEMAKKRTTDRVPRPRPGTTHSTSPLVAMKKSMNAHSNIAERKRSEEALRASEARLQAAIDAAAIGVWEWDLVSGQMLWLGPHDQLFGFAPGEFDGTVRSFEKCIHPDDVEELSRVVRRARDQGQYAHEYRIIWPDGSIH